MNNLVLSSSLSLSGTGPASGPSTDAACQCVSHLPCKKPRGFETLQNSTCAFWHSLFLVSLRSAPGSDPKALPDHLHLKVSPSWYSSYKLICVWNGCSRVKIHFYSKHFTFFFWSFKKQDLRTNSLHFKFQVGLKIQPEILSSELFIGSMKASHTFYN